MDKFKKVLKQRWRYYLVGYVIGVFVSTFYSRVPHRYYLMPLKPLTIFMAISVGTAFYYSSIKLPVFEGAIRITKYVLILVLIMVVIGILRSILMAITGFDISQFIGVN